MKNKNAILIYISCSAVAWLGAEGMRPAFGAEKEADIRKKVQAAYAAAEGATEKIRAIDLLKNPKEKKSAEMLYKVVSVETIKEVKEAAFEKLCDMTDTDGSLSYWIANGFRLEKDRDAKLKMAKAMGGLEFRWSVLQQLCQYVARLRYPSIPNRNDFQSSNSKGGLGTAQNYDELVKKLKADQKYVTDFLEIINKLGGENFQPSNRSPQDVKKWWQKQQATILKSDMKLKQDKKKASEKK